MRAKLREAAMLRFAAGDVEADNERHAHDPAEIVDHGDVEDLLEQRRALERLRFALQPRDEGLEHAEIGGSCALLSNIRKICHGEA